LPGADARAAWRDGVRLMPGRFAPRSRPAGPRPFSSEWLAAPEPVAPEPTRLRFPAWIPDGRALSAGFVVLISLATAVVTVVHGGGVPVSHPSPVPEAAAPTMAAPPAAPTTAPAPAVAQEAAGDALDGGIEEFEAAPAAEFAQAPELAIGAEAPVVAAPLDRPLLPEFRIVTFYGHPHDANMGIVGEYAIEDLATLLRAEALNYAAADPSRPVIPAFELIATVAQRVPGSDGTYILDTDRDTLNTYIDFAAAQGMLVVLDLQIGRGTVAQEIEKVRDLLALPTVHLAIDPEFAVAEGEIPGEYIGSVSAGDIAYAQQVLAEIATTNGIPPKILIVHQFREDMIAGKMQLGSYPGVQLVIDADGYGAPELKTAVYNFLVRDEPVEFAGVKLFYRQDMPMMSAQEILALIPAPDVVIYQ
jgi:hypothetical protein